MPVYIDPFSSSTLLIAFYAKGECAFCGCQCSTRFFLFYPHPPLLCSQCFEFAIKQNYGERIKEEEIPLEFRPSKFYTEVFDKKLETPKP